MKAVLAYDGTDFAGFQRQPSQRTVQGELEAALARMYGQAVTVSGAGRTDTGVHARGQVVSWQHPGGPPPDRVALAVRPYLPGDMAVRGSEAAEPSFDPRRWARQRVYCYQFVQDRWADPLRDRFVARFGYGLDLEAMAKAAALLVGHHDYRSMSCVEPDERTHRSIDAVGLRTEGALSTVEWRAQSFLRKQVRCMMGALVAVGRGWAGPTLISELLDGQPWPAQLAVAPPNGLVLERVEY